MLLSDFLLCSVQNVSNAMCLTCALSNIYMFFIVFIKIEIFHYDTAVICIKVVLLAVQIQKSQNVLPLLTSMKKMKERCMKNLFTTLEEGILIF